MSERLTKQIDLEELGYDYVLIDETKQPSANYKLGEYENIDTDPEHLKKINKAFGLLKSIFELTSIPILLKALYDQQKITAEDRLLLEEMLIRG